MDILITGGAHGIGLATAEHLDERGHEVIILDRDEDHLADVPDRFETHHLDVYDHEAVEDELGDRDIDVLVNNAGYQRLGTMEDIEPEVLEEHFRTNVFGPVHMARLFLPTLRENKGRIINVTSVAGRITGQYWGAYAGSKHALEAISDAMRMEVADDDVDVIVVEPGAYQTGFNEQGREHLRELVDGSHYADRYQRALDRDPGGHDPEEAGHHIADIIEDGQLPRYAFPLHARVVLRLRWLLPDRAWDWLAKKVQ